MKQIKMEPGSTKMSSISRITSILFWLALWQAASLMIGNSIILAGPLETGKALLSQLISADFWNVFFSSCLRISLGFLGAFLLAAVLFFHAYPGASGPCCPADEIGSCRLLCNSGPHLGRSRPAFHFYLVCGSLSHDL